jgi:serine/threonine protein kinase
MRKRSVDVMSESNSYSQNLHILLVDNQPEIISRVHSLLSEIQECRLKVQSSHHAIEENLEKEPHDLIFVAHQDRLPELVTQLRERFPETYVIILLPTFDESLINQYIGCGAHGLVFKNENFETDFVTTTRKALLRVMERKPFLVSSLSKSSFFAENRDLEQLLSRAKALQTGQTILHYKIVQALGEGGMGEVYKADDQKLRRQVAIKVLPPRIMRDSIARKRLVREAIAASALNHPNIITIYSIEETEDLDFIVMEFVEGKSLYSMLKKGPVPLIQLIDIGLGVSDALSTAHSAGLIHRDIKPGNIMISKRGPVKLLDFGLAKWMAHMEEEFSGDARFTSNLTETGTPVGTINYMSPEQTRGEQLDPRTDIFSLGSVLYEGATGKTPFQGVSILTVLHQIAAEFPEAPSRIQPSLPKSFDELIARAMAKEPQERFQSAVELLEALNRLKTDAGQSQQFLRPKLNTPPIPFETTMEKTGRDSSDPGITAGTKGRIFLVEDNEDNRDMLTRRLRRKGYEVSFAVNGRDALDQIPSHQPDLILMDISLPLVDGIEVSRRLKSSDSTRQIPIIALTAHAMAGDREKALAAGCDDYDTKPVDLERLLNKMSHWLNKKQRS